MGRKHESDESKDIWEPLDPGDEAQQENVRSVVRTAAWVLLAIILAAFMWWAIANMILTTRTASGETIERAAPSSAAPRTRNTRVPCHAPPTLATCTPSATALATDTPASTATFTATNTPVSLATETVTETPTTAPTDTPTRTNTPVSTATALATNTATRTPTPDYRNPRPNILAAEDEMRTLINNHRASRGQQPFLHFVELDRAQRRWAVEMVVTNQCYHGDFGQRAAQEGYTGFAWGEAGSCGYASAADAFQGWLDSPGHRGIVEAVTMTEFGVGAQTYPNGYWQFWLLVGCDAQIPCSGSAEMEPRPAPLRPLVGPGHVEKP